MDDSKNCVLVACREYTTILKHHLYPGIYQGLKSIWDDSRRTAAPRKVYEEFQSRLTRVKKWNQDVIDKEYQRIVDKSRCDWLDELIKRVFVINTQILAAADMHTMDPAKKIKVKVPKGDKFIHFCYKECARAFYENALLMEDRAGTITRVEQIKNLQRAYKLIHTCIDTTIRGMLPIESLLKNNMDDDGEGEDATPSPMLFSSIRPPPLSESPFSRNPAAAPHFPTYDSGAQETDAPPPSAEILKPSTTFNPETLFERRSSKSHDSEGERADRPERERGDSDRERDRERQREDDREREPERGQQQLNERGEVKTIYIGPTKGKSRDRELRSEDSDEPKPSFGGGSHHGEVVAEISTAEIPMIGQRTPHETMDLDVNTDRNELHILPSRPEDTAGTGSVETMKDPVPAIEHFDTAHFFSDVE